VRYRKTSRPENFRTGKLPDISFSSIRFSLILLLVFLRRWRRVRVAEAVMRDSSLLELERVIPLRRPTGKDPKPRENAEDCTSLSAETIKREFPEYVVKLSKRREGIKIKHVLKIAEGQS
jgi:hypothetical protein